jgi:transcriptional regulator with XRE-family HTH domain
MPDPISDTLRSALKRKGWTQARIAGILGVTPQLVSQWLSGRTKPGRDNIFKIAKTLEIPVDSFMLPDEKPPESAPQSANEQFEIALVDVGILRVAIETALRTIGTPDYAARKLATEWIEEAKKRAAGRKTQHPPQSAPPVGDR